MIKSEKNEIIVRYSEIFLKSEPVKKIFIKKLVNNISNSLKKNKIRFKIYQKRGRIFIKTKNKKTEKLLKKIFGIVSFSFCCHIKLNELEKFFEKNYSKLLKNKKTFAIKTTRTGKHDFTSREMTIRVADKIPERYKVNLTNPEVTIYIEIRDKDAYVYTEKIKGSGGMPVGTAGKVLVLLSGGIDSAVAAWMMMKRGCIIDVVYADNQNKKKKKRFLKIVKELEKWSNCKIKKHTFNQKKYLDKIIKKIPNNMICVFCKRQMYREAEKIAKKEKCKAIITGESLGQVASQTLDNLSVLDQAVSISILRPLIGFDKQEIIEIAKKIGTYEISIAKVKECDYVPKKPMTNVKLKDIEKIEELKLR
ncbi:MAG: tRNA uracil 4-sulfurtransferase ThiI [Candidatus Heimdallarchaeaceae archaeon]